MQLYVNFERVQKSDAPYHGHTVSALQGHGDGGHGGGGGRGRGAGGGCGDPNARKWGLVSQDEIDRVTDVDNKHT
jgi:hypothetical protein